jgi:hypothetical protein
MKELAQYRKQIRLISPPRPPPIGGAKVQHPTRTGLWFWSVFCGRYAMKFPGSDAAVVRNTQRCLLTHEGSEVAVRRRMPQYSAFFTLASLRSCLTTVVMGGIFSVLAGRAWGRRLLLRFHGLFSLGTFSAAGPSKEQMRETSFRMEFDGRGFTDESCMTPAQARVAVSGPEPGYIATPRIFLCGDVCEASPAPCADGLAWCVDCALHRIDSHIHTSDMMKWAARVRAVARTLLDERADIVGRGARARKGGVFTPGAVFAATTLVRRLQEVGITFQVVSRSP